MSLRRVAPGYLYVLSNDFPINEMVTITKSKLPPDQFLKSIKSDSHKDQKWMIDRPTEILFSTFLDNCSLIEGKIHEFLISKGFSAGAPKDYQIKLKDAIFLIETLIHSKHLDPKKVLPPISHTQVLPEEGCNYHLLGNLFNGTYSKSSHDCDPYHIDHSVAFQCFKRGSDLGDEKCFYHLALCYEHGMGTEISLDRADDHYRQVFALNPIKGINGLYRIFLKKGELLRAAGVFENFIQYCDNPNELKGSSDEDFLVQKILESHKSFITVMSQVLLDTFLQAGDFDILLGYQDIFSEYTHSIVNHLKRESKFLKESSFEDKSVEVDKCLEHLESFLDEKFNAVG